MNDAEREDFIVQQGEAMKAALAAGDKAKACEHMAAMRQAIWERSPEQIARMEHERGLDYFTQRGAEDRLDMLGRLGGTN